MVIDGNGNEVESFSFDPWSKRRAAILADLQAILGSWASLDAYQKRNLTIPALTLASDITNKGFTGHEQLDGVNLIHMGGRVYDAEIGRFLSADPFVQDSTNLQALNRYSYVQNNPLSYTDPSGYFLKKLIKKIGRAIGKAHESVFDAFISVHKKFFRAIAKVEGFSTAMSIGLGIACGPFAIACTTGFNAAMTAANGGTIGQVIAGAAVGFVSGGASAGIGGAFGGDLVANVGAAMVVGGSVAKAQGGKFIDGVKGAAVGAAIGGVIRGGIAAYKDYQMRRSVIFGGKVDLEFESPAMNNTMRAVSEPPGASDSVNASLPSATPNKALPESVASLDVDYSATTSGDFHPPVDGIDNANTGVSFTRADIVAGVMSADNLGSYVAGGVVGASVVPAGLAICVANAAACARAAYRAHQFYDAGRATFGFRTMELSDALPPRLNPDNFGPSAGTRPPYSASPR